MYYEVMVGKVFKKSMSARDGILTYESDLDLKPGTVVEVPLGKSTALAIVYKKVKKPTENFKLKKITQKFFETPLPPHILKSILWLNSYYLSPLPELVKMFLPNGLTLKNAKKLSDNQISSSKISDTEISLNSAQKTTLENLKLTKPHTKLLHGVTGSGKTNIYLTLAKEQFKNQKSTILLVPEIALTSQLVQVFEQTFGNEVILIHSQQTDKTRREIWSKILHETNPKIIIGPRSALLSPVQNLGLIIIDEAHEQTYFQESPPKYHALRLASFIANSLNIDCIFGTATPAVFDYYLATKNHALVELKERAKATAKDPDIHIIDLKNKQNFLKNRFFSDQLLHQIEQNLSNHTQTLIFHNRRGSSPLTVCESCGWEALCPNCLLPMTLHIDQFELLCHTCGHKERIPTKCPTCGHLEIVHKGFGTKLLESELKRLFKNANVARFDADNNKSETLNENYEAVKNGEVDIIVGTQTIAKGLDLPHLSTIGVVQADAGLSLPDFSTEERTFFLLNQVLGRVGRGHLDEANAYIQTYQPDSPVITSALSNNYEKFYNYIIKKRRQAHLPPYFFIAKFSVVYKTEKTTLSHIKSLKSELERLKSTYNSLEISVPAPAFHERTTSGFVWQIILKSTSRSDLLSVIQNFSTRNDLHLVIDPPSLL